MAGELAGAGFLSVEDALARILDGVEPTPEETVSLTAASGRVLAAPLAARRTQPPVTVSSMDGYAVRAADAVPGGRLHLVGAAPAGHPFSGSVGPGECVRIFTGAPLPDGADTVLLQEDASAEAGVVAPREAVRRGQYVRPAGLDFTEGQELLPVGRLLGPREIALAAAMNHDVVRVRRRPYVAILATGDELVPPGAARRPGQIVDATSAALAALAEAAGGTPLALDILADNAAALAAAGREALHAGADILVTLGGASVGDHDLVRPALAGIGFTLDFWRVALRPGRPTLFGRLGATRVLGLPGNPVSSLVTGLVFLRPLIESLSGRALRDPAEPARLGSATAANDWRQDYVRATLTAAIDALPVATPLPRQDSSMLATLAAADCLIIRPPHAPAAPPGTVCRVIRL